MFRQLQATLVNRSHPQYGAFQAESMCVNFSLAGLNHYCNSFALHFHLPSQVLDGIEGDASSPRAGGSSDELWAQMQVRL